VGEQLYETRLRLYQALLNRDVNEALRLTRKSVDAALSELSAYIS